MCVQISSRFCPTIKTFLATPLLKGILSQSVGSTQNYNMMLCDPAESGDSRLARPKKILPWPDFPHCWRISSTVTSVIAEEKGQGLQKIKCNFA